MIDMDGILADYLPLQLIRFGDVYAPDEQPEVWLNEYDFIWRPAAPDNKDQQLYFGVEPIRFTVEGQQGKAKYINQALAGAPLRLPNISMCWGDESLMLSDTLADKLDFSAMLGVTRTAATLVDAAGQERSGFTALSFHKVFFHQRVTTRLAQVPAQQRPIIKILLKRHRHTYLVHKSILAAWQEQGIQDVCYDIAPKYQSFKRLCNLDMYFGSVATVSFSSLADFQQQTSPIWWAEDDDEHC